MRTFWDNKRRDCKSKMIIYTKEEAREDSRIFNVYSCPHCGFWHRTTKPSIKKRERRRGER